MTFPRRRLEPLTQLPTLTRGEGVLECARR
jgi:hypothetical protein